MTSTTRGRGHNASSGQGELHGDGAPRHDDSNDRNSQGNNELCGGGCRTKSYDTLGTIPRIRPQTAKANPGNMEAYFERSTAEVGFVPVFWCSFPRLGSDMLGQAQ